MSLILQRKAEILDDVDAQKAALYQARRSRKRCSSSRSNAIGVYHEDPRDRPRGPAQHRRADQALPRALALGGAARRLHARRPIWSLDPDEKKHIFYQVGAVYERELSDVARAIDTYQKVLELDPDDLTALGRLDVLYQTAGNWQELLSVLQHEAELTSDPAEAVSYQYRIAELYEKHLGDVERAVELYREILNIQPDHAPTLPALEGIKNGERAPLAAAGVLEPVYDAMGEWPKLISVLEVQVRFTRRSVRQGGAACTASRASTRRAWTTTRSAFETYARAVGVDSQNEESLGALERLAIADRALAGRGAALRRRARQARATSPSASSSSACASRRSTRCSSRTSNNAVARYRRVLEVDPENQSAVRSLDRLFTQTERWRELAEILAREAEIGQSPDEILEFKYRLGQVYQMRLGDLDQAIAAYREVISAAPEHAGHAARAREPVRDAASSSSRSARSSSRSTSRCVEWEKLIRVHEAELAHITRPRASASRCTTASPRTPRSA